MSNVSTFSAFTTARLGIYASQKAMEVVGNNISNINTEGYTRQVLNQESIYLGGADRYISKSDVTVGTGARCTSVSQLRDPYLDIRYRNELSSVGAMDGKLAGLEQLSSIFDEVGDGLDGEGVIEAQFNDLMEQMQNLVTNGAGNEEYNTLVRSSAKSLIALFNTYGDKLQTLMKNEETSFRQDVSSINDILSSISELNDEIYRSEIHGSDALELKDSRNVMIDQLSQYIRINVSYEKVDLGAGTIVDKLVIKLAGNDAGTENNNATLVDGNYATRLSTQSPVYTTDADGNKTITSYTDNPDYGITFNPLIDKNGATLEGSDYEILSDNNLYGSLQAMREMLTEKGEYSSEADIAADPKAATKRGIPFYINQLDALANKFATVMNEANTMTGPDLYANDGTNYTKADGTALVDADGNPIPVADPIKEENLALLQIKTGLSHYNGGALFSNSGNSDSTENITALNISISSSWANNSVQLLQSRQEQLTEQSTDNSNLVHMLSLLDSDQDYAPGDIAAGADSASKTTAMFTGSFQEMLGDISSTLANDVKTTTAMLENYSAAADELYVDRESFAGVDLNDEAVGMMQYQKSYSAACRMLTTLDEMLDKLINGTAM